MQLTTVVAIVAALAGAPALAMPRLHLSPKTGFNSTAPHVAARFSKSAHMVHANDTAAAAAVGLHQLAKNVTTGHVVAVAQAQQHNETVATGHAQQAQAGAARPLFLRDNSTVAARPLHQRENSTAAARPLHQRENSTVAARAYLNDSASAAVAVHPRNDSAKAAPARLPRSYSPGTPMMQFSNETTMATKRSNETAN